MASLARLAPLAIVAFYDELWSGVAVVGAPGVEDAQGVGHAGYALWIFAVPLLLAAVIEAPLAAWSDRMPRSTLLRASLATLSACLALCAIANQPWVLSFALSVAGAASGVACAMAQGELVTSHAGQTERAMSQWSAFASAGDAVAPLIVNGTIALGGTYRASLLVVAAILAIQASTLRPKSIAQAESTAPTESAEEPREPLRQAFFAPRLWGLLFATAACTLLDEVVVALSSLHLERDLHASALEITVGLTLYSLGALLGSVLLDVAVARTSTRFALAGSALASIASLMWVVRVESPLAAMGALFVLGVVAVPHYPLLKACAYDVVPSRPGLVNAVAQVFVVLDIALPLAVGVVAARYGLGAAILSLAAQPLLVVVASLWWVKERVPQAEKKGEDEDR